MLELNDIQGIILSGYRKKQYASYVLVRVQNAAKARAWVRSLAQRVTSAADRPEDACVNVAFSARGLTALQLDAKSLGTFPLEFREGLAGSDTRSRTLGDTDESAPSTWAWGGPAAPVDAMLMLYAKSQAAFDALHAAELAALGAGGALSPVVEVRAVDLPERREHFGFADGITQPTIQGSRRAKMGEPSVAAGEFILGYPNEYGQLATPPSADAKVDVGGNLAEGAAPGERSLGRNGSYLVVRQLRQHVFRFWDYMKRASGGSTASPDAAIALASKCVGRWPSGAPLVRAPERDDPSLAADNGFKYFFEDREGTRCPVGAHIRRANPRDSLEPDPASSSKVVDRHRILRRGRSYGEYVGTPWLLDRDDGVDRGLVFICANANIRRQFEFVQQTWVNNPKFSGLFDERDPLTGAPDDDAHSFSIPCAPVRRRIERLERFVTVRGGEYFFLPSIRALRFLGALSG